VTVVRVERATEEHAQDLAPRMRAEDAAEVLASGGYEPLDALLVSMDASDEAWAVFFDNELGAIYGIARGCIPWLLTSDVIDRHPKAFVGECKEVLRAWMEQHPVLVQQVDARYARALRWASRMGFRVDEPEPFGTSGLPFCRITMRRA
jgi:ABC-type nitrate/sulfonate/bicarbonate transport system substrate-binding protein